MYSEQRLPSRCREPSGPAGINTPGGKAEATTGAKVPYAS